MMGLKTLRYCVILAMLGGCVLLMRLSYLLSLLNSRNVPPHRASGLAVNPVLGIQRFPEGFGKRQNEEKEKALNQRTTKTTTMAFTKLTSSTDMTTTTPATMETRKQAMTTRTVSYNQSPVVHADLKRKLTTPGTNQIYDRPCTGNKVYKGPCTCVRFPDHDLPGSVLYSLAGSGNTWTRFLLEQVSGYFTGSMNYDPDLKKGGFRGEYRQDSKVFAIKTHSGVNETLKKCQKARDTPIARAVVLIRDTFNASMSELMRRITHGSHTDTGSELSITVVRLYLRGFRDAGSKRTLEWISQSKLPIFVLRYDALTNNLVEALKSVMAFLQMPVIEGRLECIKRHSEGKFHRGNRTTPRSSIVKMIRSVSEPADKLVEDTLKLRYKSFPNLTCGYLHNSHSTVKGSACNF
ncbi:WSC domain-containing protein 1 [Lingula anatina]|uniref:WSC domain-containing protein 1 n=1 Tax=Lingula anatina TaxID=7574 RepID=A0A1S3KEW7_LINAN|nr:WSC domain-containing protein 1 [Lingula anatina]XP_013421174.1 WSC domain-containing protein 1 [Lingula anatina]|eukprot:XP_013421173.1 WSC domain-containing protein 1 [Lingula anatina]